MNWPAILDTANTFLAKHKEALALFSMSAIVTMRKTLPWPFSRVEALEWSYEWLRDALMTLLSLKGPIPHGPESQSSERITKAPDGSVVESVKEKTVVGASPAVDPAKENA